MEPVDFYNPCEKVEAQLEGTMRLSKVATEAGNPIEKLFVVEEISPDDIGPPSEHFLRFIRSVSSFSFVNSFTLGEFTEQVRKRFASANR